MGFEIERKFMVIGNFKQLVTKKYKIKQGYLSTTPKNTVRVRVQDSIGTITVKGKPLENSITRFEWEKEIPPEEANELLLLCQSGIIHKTRHIIPEQSGLKFEIDEFHDENFGLVIAEIELPYEDYKFEKPQWLGDEVTGDIRYYNSYLSQNPFKDWD